MQLPAAQLQMLDGSCIPKPIADAQVRQLSDASAEMPMRVRTPPGNAFKPSAAHLVCNEAAGPMRDFQPAKLAFVEIVSPLASAACKLVYCLGREISSQRALANEPPKSVMTTRNENTGS